MTFEKRSKSFEECLILQDVIVRGEHAEREDGPLFEISFFCNC